jgi:hypothetical protein
MVPFIAISVVICIAINGTISSVLPGDVHTVNETTSSVPPDDLYRVNTHFNVI